VFPIEAGPRVVVGDVRVTGTRVFTEDTLRRLLPLKRGAPWSEKQAEEGRRVVERRYARRGFHATEVTVAPRRHDGVADVTYEVQEGPQTRIGQILISGLVQTREYVIRRELPFHPGDPLDPEQLLEAQRRLVALALFDRVDVDPLRPPPTPFADVTVTIRERKPWHVDFGGGYTTYEGVRGFVEFGGDNLWGHGRSILLRGRISERGDREDITYTEPWALWTPWRGEITLFHEKRLEIGYDIERYGIALGLQGDLFTERVRGLHGALRYEIAEVDRFNVDPTLTTEDIQRGKERIGTFTQELSLDRRDHPFDPRKGSFTVVSLRTASFVLGSEADFVKSRLETQWFFDRVGPGVLGVALRLGAAAPFNRSPNLPIEERFFAGGATTVRGYPERKLGPLDDKGNPTGGNALAIFNIEWRFPVWRFISGAVFFDTGAVASEIERMSVDHFKSGIGAGIRLSTPVGPVRLDAGYPLDDIPRENRELRFYFSIGYPF
jgi:outer membrane protein insertion porin family